MVEPQKDASASLENVDRQLSVIWLHYLVL